MSIFSFFMNRPLSWSIRRQFFEQAASQLDNGRNDLDILADFAKRLERKGKRRAARQFAEIARRMRDGSTMTAAMGEHLTYMERGVLSAGEKAGKAQNAMELILEIKELTENVSRRFRAAMMGPLANAVMLGALLIFLGAYVNPMLADTVPTDKWTGWAWVLYVMGSAATGWIGPAIVILFGIVCYLINASFASWAGKRVPGRIAFDKYFLPYTIYREMHGFSWLLSYAALVRAGLSDEDAIAGQINHASAWMRSRLEPILQGIRNGLRLDAAMRRTGMVFPSPDLIDEVGAYVDAPDFSMKISKVGRTYAKTLERRLLSQSTIIAAVIAAGTYVMILLVQLGSNEISSMMATSTNAFH